MDSEYEKWVIRMRKWPILIIAGIAWLLLLVTPVLAASVDVGVSAQGLVVGGGNCLTNFTITYVSVTRFDFSWGYGANTTSVMIRGKYGGYPADIPNDTTEPSDGYLVYSGNATFCSDTSVVLD